MSGQVSRGSAGEYQTDEQAGVARLSGQVSRGSAGEYQADERAKGGEGKWKRAVTQVHGPGFLSCLLWGPHQWPCFRARSSASHN